MYVVFYSLWWQLFGHMLHVTCCSRVKSLLDATKATVATGGNLDEKSNYIAPTLLTNVSPDDAVMKEEVSKVTSISI